MEVYERSWDDRVICLKPDSWRGMAVLGMEATSVAGREMRHHSGGIGNGRKC